jgi:hypothetical protein
LRPPANISVFACWRPNPWLHRAQLAGPAEAVSEAWRNALLDQKEFMGVSIKNPQRRDANMVALANVIPIACRKLLASRMPWRPLKGGQY